MRRVIGILLLAHGLAHAAAGVWASGMEHGWLAIVLWAIATSNLVGAGLGLLGARGLRAAWRQLAIAGAVASLMMLSLFVQTTLIPGLLIDLGVILIAWRLPNARSQPSLAPACVASSRAPATSSRGCF